MGAKLGSLEVSRDQTDLWETLKLLNFRRLFFLYRHTNITNHHILNSAGLNVSRYALNRICSGPHLIFSHSVVGCSKSQVRNAYTILIRKILTERDHLGELTAKVRTILKWILKKQDLMVWSGFVSLTRGCSCGL